MVRKSVGLLSRQRWKAWPSPNGAAGRVTRLTSASPPRGSRFPKTGSEQTQTGTHDVRVYARGTELRTRLVKRRGIWREIARQSCLCEPHARTLCDSDGFGSLPAVCCWMASVLFTALACLPRGKTRGMKTMQHCVNSRGDFMFRSSSVCCLEGLPPPGLPGEPALITVSRMVQCIALRTMVMASGAMWPDDG